MDKPLVWCWPTCFPLLLLSWQTQQGSACHSSPSPGSGCTHRVLTGGQATQRGLNLPATCPNFLEPWSPHPKNGITAPGLVWVVLCVPRYSGLEESRWVQQKGGGES